MSDPPVPPCCADAPAGRCPQHQQAERAWPRGARARVRGAPVLFSITRKRSKPTTTERRR